MLLQLSASAVALGLMGSAVGVHYSKVQKGVAVHEEISPQYDEIALATYTEEFNPVGLGEVSFQVEDSVASSSEEELQLKLLQGMVDKMEALMNENTQLRQKSTELEEQVAETNRDLTLLQLRVDTHSESFRPLRVSEENTFYKAIPAHPVLPPKNW